MRIRLVELLRRLDELLLRLAERLLLDELLLLLDELLLLSCCLPSFLGSSFRLEELLLLTCCLPSLLEIVRPKDLLLLACCLPLPSLFEQLNRLEELLLLNVCLASRVFAETSLNRLDELRLLSWLRLLDEALLPSCLLPVPSGPFGLVGKLLLLTSNSSTGSSFLTSGRNSVSSDPRTAD